MDKSSGVEDPEKPGYLKYTSGSLPGIVWIKNQCTHCSAKLHRHTRQRSGNIKLDSLTNNVAAVAVGKRDVKIAPVVLYAFFDELCFAKIYLGFPGRMVQRQITFRFPG